MTTAIDELLAGLASFDTRPAIESPDRLIDYAELIDEVDALADRLRLEAGAVAGSRVLISTHHSAGTVIAMLACARAHLTYVPVPSEIPAARLAHIRDVVQPVAHLEDSAHALVVEKLERSGSYGIPRNARMPAVVPLAVLHTSGSTGTPKSVLIAHENLDHFLRWCQAALPLDGGDRVALLSPLHFDLCTHDIFHGLGSGATLVLPSDFTRTSPQAASAFIDSTATTSAYMVPTFLERVAQSALRSGTDARSIRRVMFAGERLTNRGRRLVEKAYPDAELHNLYGPIETNVITAVRLDRDHRHNSSEVGSALPGVTLRVRPPGGTLAESGRGELVAAGTAVTPGYLDSHQNAQRLFDAEGQRWYRTGDEATLSGGSVYLHGRMDNMVKIRGQRVELEEIETTIDGLHTVEKAAVIVGTSGDSVDAYIEVATSASAAEPGQIQVQIVEYCRKLLPSVAVPGSVRVLPEMPVTATGKVDRQALKALRAQSTPHLPEGSARPSRTTSPAQLIAHHLAQHLGSAPAELKALRALRDHPRFNSMVAAQCIEAVEDHLGRAADYDKFTDKSLETIASMGELFAHHD
ncbi:AMP-binding protein [Nocardia sp. NPDC058114]|uniref:AMP-binding protein n=1 Tax=Nocardia sp. NPDC058114 TaxID=3346346 RepID=UPI0036D9C296